MFTKKAFIKRIFTAGALKTMTGYAPIMSTSLKVANLFLNEREDFYVSLVRYITLYLLNYTIIEALSQMKIT